MKGGWLESYSLLPGLSRWLQEDQLRPQKSEDIETAYTIIIDIFVIAITLLTSISPVISIPSQ